MALREIALACGLTEEVKWSKPCFTFHKKNVAIVIPLKESCAFTFFNGALLKDRKRVLANIGEHGREGRWIKFASVGEIRALKSTLRDYLHEGIALAKAGKTVAPRKPVDLPVPEALQNLIDNDGVLRRAFDALTPGRRRSYYFHISGAKQEKTRVTRARKCVPRILKGLGFLERSRPQSASGKRNSRRVTS